MPFISGVFLVGEQIEPLQQSDANVFSGLLKNVGKRTAFLGAEDVSVDNGFPFEPGEVIEADMHAKASLYAISTQDGTELRWITVT